MTTINISKTLFVLVKGGEPMPRNGEDDRNALYRSRAHAMRVIKWLGLNGYKVREATEEEIANGVYCAAHETPNWTASDKRLPVPDGVATLS